jgi:hypothetical protein
VGKEVTWKRGRREEGKKMKDGKGGESKAAA